MDSDPAQGQRGNRDASELTRDEGQARLDAVKDYDQMYLEAEEESCVKACYLKSFEFQRNLSQELSFLVRNL